MTSKSPFQPKTFYDSRINHMKPVPTAALCFLQQSRALLGSFYVTPFTGSSQNAFIQEIISITTF